jgi:hypothetical protein
MRSGTFRDFGPWRTVKPRRVSGPAHPSLGSPQIGRHQLQLDRVLPGDADQPVAVPVRQPCGGTARTRRTPGSTSGRGRCGPRSRRRAAARTASTGWPGQPAVPPSPPASGRACARGTRSARRPGSARSSSSGSLPSWPGGPGRPELGAWARRCQRDTAKPTTRTYSRAQLSPAPLEAAILTQEATTSPCATARATGCVRPAGRTGSCPGPFPARTWRPGRVPSDQCDNFHLCRDCLQDLVLSVSLRPAERTLPAAAVPGGGPARSCSIRPRPSSAAAPPERGHLAVRAMGTWPQS